jgi:hypothetical protein
MFTTLRLLLALALTVMAALAYAPTTIDDVFLPGSQPEDGISLERNSRCSNCHGDYDSAVEPDFLWKGSMMAQAQRDPLYLAALAIANQDAPGSGDLCIRCHAPSGWIEGRSVPTDGSSLTADDRESVHCDVCHRMVGVENPIQNPYPWDADYTADTWPQDQQVLAGLEHLPPVTGNGMYVFDGSNPKRGPYVDAVARHQMLYSPWYQDARICGTCHDVSNPVFERAADGRYLAGPFGEPAASFDSHDLFPVERTFSEWSVSEYNSAQGVYAPQFGGNLEVVRTCQDCHMRDVTGVGCNKNGVPVRDDLGMHDFTGGNTVVGRWAAALYPNETDLAAIDSAAVRARQMLRLAATLELELLLGEDGLLARVRVVNETGHKLPSGYPEGRRIWVEFAAFDGQGEALFQSGVYDAAEARLQYDDWIKVYEIKPGHSPALAQALGLEPGPSFHFVLNDTIWFDNRIPPRGFTNAAFEQIQSPAIGYDYADGQYWDDTIYPLPPATQSLIARLHYQITTREYIEFLRDENHTNDAGLVLHALWADTGMAPPEEMASLNLSLVAPPVPDLSISSTPEGLRVEWSAVAGALGYRVWQSQDPYGGEWSVQAVVEEPGLDLPAPVDGEIGFWRVTALGGSVVRSRP